MPVCDDQLDRRIADAERAIAEEEAHIRSMIVRGVSSQATEDRPRIDCAPSSTSFAVYIANPFE
jgi:hypothetical protein